MDKKKLRKIYLFIGFHRSWKDEKIDFHEILFLLLFSVVSRLQTLLHGFNMVQIELDLLSLLRCSLINKVKKGTKTVRLSWDSFFFSPFFHAQQSLSCNKSPAFSVVLCKASTITQYFDSEFIASWSWAFSLLSVRVWKMQCILCDMKEETPHIYHNISATV